MALTDDRPSGRPRPVRAADDGGEPGSPFDRQPPQDLTAEQSVLGGMLLSKDAIADVVEIIRPEDFYRPAHQTVYDCILDLYGRGEPADAVTVSAELQRRGELIRLGGAPYLHTLIATVPTAANAAYYAEIVSEKAILRRLVEAGTRIVQLGYHGVDGAEVTDVVDRAQAAIYEVTERSTSEDYVVLEELLQPTMDEIDAISSRGGVALGVPTGFVDLDSQTNGLHPGQMIVVAARPGLGKALALDTPLPTPTGWTTMGEVAVGDLLIDADGRPTRVLAATGVMTGRPTFEVEFSDGTVIVADAQHQWLTSAGAVRTTEELVAGHHAVDVCAPLQFAEADLAEDPYALGTRVAEAGWAVAGLTPYLRAAEHQRRALLAGLMDGGGVVAPDGSLRFPAAGALAADVRELVAGLGHRWVPTADGVVVFLAVDEVFRDDRKRLQHKERHDARPDREPRLRVADVRPVPSVPVRCVEVDNAAHLYLAGRSMVPTHNSTLGLDFARSCSIKHGMTSAVFSLEMSKTEIVMRLLSAEAQIRLTDMRAGRMGDDDWTRMARRMSEISEAPLFIDDSPNLTLMEIRAKARRLKQRNDLKLVILDYLQLMTSGRKVESRQQEVSEFSRQIKLLAKELEVPVVAISQLNRGPEQRTDKRPMLSDLRESGCLTAGTRLLRADNGAEVSLGELLESGERGVRLWSLDERMRMVPREMTKVFPSGVKEVFRLRLTSGREVEATANHPFLTVDGWCRLGDLTPGDRLATPRRIPAPVEPVPMDPDRIILLAHLIGAENPTAAAASVPTPVFALPDEQVALFLRHLWATDGSVSWDEQAGSGRIYYASTSRRLVDDVSRLLLRFGVLTRLERVRKDGYRDGWQLHVTGSEHQRAFVQFIGVHDAHGHVAGQMAERLSAIAANTDTDTVPKAVWSEVRTLLATRQMTHRDVAAAMGSRFCGSTTWKHSPSRSRLARAAAVLDDADLEMLATNDVFWDEIAEISSLGEQPVYDATVPGTHNFVADGIAAHNSIEQDADMVILLHRPDAFERDDPRAGEADLILAKHRNGPTNTITVAHQLHYSRFADLAHG